MKKMDSLNEWRLLTRKFVTVMMLSLIGCIFSINVMAQIVTVSGTVKNSAGETLPGVSVVVKGTLNGTNTGDDGKFSISKVPANAILSFSFVGMKTKEINVGNQKVLNVVLADEAINLDEVVAVGYGTLRKSDLTSSITKIKAEGAGETPSSTMEQMLQGRVAGVQITQNSGAPGEGMTFLIRGSNSFSGSGQPLIVVDGFPIESGAVGSNSTGSISNDRSGNALTNINPSDIETFEILKDASATAIYGSLGANGVVLITTKRGRKGRDKIEYTFRADISQMAKKLDLLSTLEYQNYSNESLSNSGLGFTVNENSYFSPSIPNIDWQDLVFQTAFSKDHTLSLSGGNDDFKYSIIGGYSDMEGIVRYTSAFNRYTLRANIDRNIGKRLKLSLNISGAATEQQSAAQSSVNGNIAASIPLGAILSLPITSPFNADGTYNIEYQGNPVTNMRMRKDITTGKTITITSSAVYEIFKGLTFSIRPSFSYFHSIRDIYEPRGTFTGDTNKGLATQGNVDRSNSSVDNLLNFNREYGKHRINAIAGAVYSQWFNRSLFVKNQNFLNDNLSFYNLGAGNSPGTPSTSYEKYSLMSYLSRINYTFDNKYIVTVTGRTDGASRLAPGHKWAFFPSAALAWNLQNEKFIKDNFKAITELKPRISYGVSGSQSGVGVGSTNAYFSTIFSTLNGTVTNGYYQSNLPNSMLGWESTSQVDLGLNVGLWRGRLTFGFDYYQKRTTDLLMNVPVPTSTGYASYTMNTGETENKGYEFDLGAVIFSKTKVKWSLSGNLSTNRNKIISLGASTDIYGSSFLAAGLPGIVFHRSSVGHSIGEFYGYVFDGIYQTQKEIDNSAYDASAKPEPGLWKFKDISGIGADGKPDGKPDGLITSVDQTFIGNPYPKFTFGLNNSLSYKELSVNFSILGSYGNDILNLTKMGLTSMQTGYTLLLDAWTHRWTGEGTTNTYAKSHNGLLAYYGRANSFMIEDGSYIRLKTITLAYNLPIIKMSFLGSGKLKLFATATNLLTLTKYTGSDPEVSSRGSNQLTPGVDFGSIPNVRSFSIGFNLLF
jgi:TonB-linked SusC/RagA family outer membrane protein